MTIRTFQPGDESAQVTLYNTAAAALPKFKPATDDEIGRRVRAADFDPATRFFAVADGRPVGYASFHANGRVSYPWCLPGHEGFAGPLFDAVTRAMKGRGLAKAWAAYRGDWPGVAEFFTSRGFSAAREMINFVLDLAEMPTPAARPSSPFSPLTPEDLPAVLALSPQTLRCRDVNELERHLLHNPYFGPEALFVLRTRTDNAPAAVGVLIENESYADPRQIDAAMPCFRLGAFGTEGTQTKRVKGLFSVLARDNQNVSPLALDLMGYAAFRLRETDVDTLAAQVPSDAPHLVRFYKQYFRWQASFPVFERDLTSV